MFSVTKLLALFFLASTSVGVAATTTLRVCADPNNLPFSNRAQEGFENHLAEMIAKDLGMQVSYDWFPQRSAFFRKTLNAGQCDVVMGVPSGISVASTTIPYYSSSYVFITRRASHLELSSMDDPRLRRLRIGVHITGDQDSNLPPVNALLSRGIVRNLVGYSIYGKLSEKNPPADLIQAVVSKNVDVAIAWGPMAGYFARHSSVPLTVTPVDVVSPNPNMPFTFAISMGVRHGDRVLLQQLNAEIQRREPQIREMLDAYGVPLLATSPTVRVGN
jgi:quinoprotein dehydrogenase-associated probable ABC transporter substrate-binding protein